MRPVPVEEVRPGVIVAASWPGPIRQDERWENRAEFSDFARRLGIGESIKRDMREKYSRRAHRQEPFDRMYSRAVDFWAAYEEVNRQWIPEDPVYSKAIQGAAMSTTADSWELGAASAGQTRILEHFIGGEATTSAVLRCSIKRVSTQGTGTAPTSYTPEKFNTRSPAAAGTYYGALTANVAWGTSQATLASNPLITHAFNAFGGTDRWVAQPGEEIYLVNAEFASLRSDSGTSTISAYVVVEEL